MPGGPAGESDAHPRFSFAADRIVDDGQEGSYVRQRPPGADGADPGGVRAWPGPGDVIAQELHERLARRHPGAGGVSRSDEDASGRSSEERHR